MRVLNRSSVGSANAGGSCRSCLARIQYEYAWGIGLQRTSITAPRYLSPPGDTEGLDPAKEDDGPEDMMMVQHKAAQEETVRAIRIGPLRIDAHNMAILQIHKLATRSRCRQTDTVT
jgi:hypothetical protein